MYRRRYQAKNRRWKRRHPGQVTRIQRRFYRLNATRLRKYRVDWWVALRDFVRRAMGRRCACCGETTPDFLTVDHVRNDGRKHRTKGGFRNPYLYYSEIKRAFGSGRVAEVRRVRRKYQLLCWNCNTAKQFRGACPHRLADAKAK